MFYDDDIIGFTNRDIDTNWNMFKEKLRYVFDKHILPIVISSFACAPWFTDSMKTLLNKKKRRFRAARLCKSESARARYDECAKQYKHDTFEATNKRGASFNAFD